MRLILALVAIAGLTACDPAVAPVAPEEPSQASTQPSPAPVAAAEPMEAPTPPPRPNIIVRADPAPPHTYWAPEGSEIHNHPSVDDVWMAYVDGRQVGYYFGDGCGASLRQDWIGLRRSELPARPADEAWRIFETAEPTTDDLRRERTNIEIDPETQRVVRVSCG